MDLEPGDAFRGLVDGVEVDGYVTSVVRTSGVMVVQARGDGPRLWLSLDTDNEYNRCARCGQIDPQRHRWYFVEFAGTTEAALLDAFALLDNTARKFVMRYNVKGTIRLQEGEYTEHGIRIQATVIPDDECGA